MEQNLIYLDNHATTRVDPRVIAVMLPLLESEYGNAGSITHVLGERAREAVERSRLEIAEMIGASKPTEIVFTSGATESNNLAIRGACLALGDKGHIITAKTEHSSVLDPIEKLERSGFEVSRIDVHPNGSRDSGLIDFNQLENALRDDTVLVSIMLANNETGVIQPLQQIAFLCHQRGALLHTDATQALGRIPVNVEQLGADLMSFSGHKIYGPKGIGGLYVRQTNRRVRLSSQIDGGGQEFGRRSGTQNVPGIVGMARALQLCVSEIPGESRRLARLRNQLYELLCDRLGDLPLNGPPLEAHEQRLTANLNCQFPDVDGFALMTRTPDVAVSSGSACTSANPRPSSVLRAMGLNDVQIRSSLRFGLGRFTTEKDVEQAAELLGQTAVNLMNPASNP